MSHHNKNECHHKSVDKHRGAGCNKSKGKNPIEIHCEVVAVYDGHVMSRKQVLVCCSAFKDEHMNLQNDPCVGHQENITLYVC